jgi:hypothetical protein
MVSPSAGEEVACRVGAGAVAETVLARPARWPPVFVTAADQTVLASAAGQGSTAVGGAHGGTGQAISAVWVRGSTLPPSTIFLPGAAG